MSKLPGNPYVEEMKNAVVDERPETWLTHGDIATLALAFEVRTVALLLASSMGGNGAHDEDALVETAMRRMGMGEGDDQ